MKLLVEWIGKKERRTESLSLQGELDILIRDKNRYGQ